LAAGKLLRTPEIDELTAAAALGHGGREHGSGEIRRRKRKPAAEPPGRGL